MDRLIEGYRRFRTNEWPAHRARFEDLAEHGQSPRAVIVACSDSRVDPTLLFGAAPGELFVIRNVANLVPPCEPDARFHATSSALEFAIRVLQVPDAIIMGHAMCGGVRALLDGVPEPAGDFLASWISIAEPARRKVLACEAADPYTACEEETVKLSLANMMTFPWIAERVNAGRLRLHGTIIDIHSGILSLLREDGRFTPV